MRPNPSLARAVAVLGTAVLAAAALPARSFGETQTMRIALDKAEVVNLKAAASVVLVANPAIADVVVERNHLLFVVGKQAGETRLYIYGDHGQVVLERDVIVVPQEERAVTVFRDTGSTSYSCDRRCMAVSGTEATPGGPQATQGGGAAAAPAAAAPAPAPTPPAAPAAPGPTASR